MRRVYVDVPSVRGVNVGVCMCEGCECGDVYV